MIRAYQAAHGGVVFYRVPSDRRRRRATRLKGLVVIAVMALSVGVLAEMNGKLRAASDVGAPATYYLTGD